MEHPPGAEAKAWGWALETNRQTENGKVLVRIVRVGIFAGGYSSIHCHNRCTNVFAVVSGKLRLQRFEKFGKHDPIDAGWVQESNDHPVSFLPGEFHQFEALTDVIAVEIYIARAGMCAGADDIERLTTNGWKKVA